MAEAGDIKVKVEAVAEFAVAKLDVKPGDVVVVRYDGNPEELRYIQESFDWIGRDRELPFYFLVTSVQFDFSVVHPLDDAEIAKAGAGGWPHEGRSGIVAGMPDDSAAET